ncbi:N-6 DNA methylase [Leptodesmis sp.]|uniref:N-6 DNA methylase n=1 Tax=Leptodesmis sp. TaxID=3100501 RepID=UPI0040534F45
MILTLADRMSFANFTNPYRKPADVPEDYRKHPNLSKLFKADGTYIRPAEDPVTIWAIALLHQEYGVPLDALELELYADFSEGMHQGGRRYQGRADMIVYDDRYIGAGGGLDVAFIMVEAMEPEKKLEGTEPEGWVEHLNRLNAYMSASPSARYAILTSGTHTKIYRRDLEYPRVLQEIGDLPKYESARSAAEHSPFKVILNPSEPDGIQTGLQPLTRDKFREVLGDTRSGCHSILRDNEGLQPQEAVDAIVKFLFAKWYDEQATIDLVKKTGEMRSYVFSYKQGETDPERLMVQVRDTFEKAKQWERDTLSAKFGDNLGIRLAFTESDALEFKPHTTVEIVKRLQPWSLRKSTADVKGGVFEDFLGKTFRDDLGQYFTPTPVINLMVGILQPTVHDFIGDPACGSARMLTHVLDYVRKRELARAEAEQSYQKTIDYVFEQLGINLECTQRKRNALVPISVLQGGRFDFEAVVTLQDISSQFAEHETTLIEEVVEQTNERITPSIDSPDEVVNYIGLANIQSNTGELVNFELVQGKEILSSSPKFSKGDILFGRMRPYLNKVWIAEFDGICSGEALVFRSNKNKVDIQFLHTLLLSQLTLDQVVPLQSGSSLPRVSASDVLSVKLPVPKDLQKQQEIGNEVKRRRNEAKQLRHGAKAVVTSAKARVERMILGEEEIGEN